MQRGCAGAFPRDVIAGPGRSGNAVLPGLHSANWALCSYIRGGYDRWRRAESIGIQRSRVLLELSSLEHACRCRHASRSSSPVPLGQRIVSWLLITSRSGHFDRSPAMITNRTAPRRSVRHCAAFVAACIFVRFKVLTDAESTSPFHHATDFALPQLSSIIMPLSKLVVAVVRNVEVSTACLFNYVLCNVLNLVLLNILSGFKPLLRLTYTKQKARL